MTRVLVTGAGGFIGHHLVRRLKAEGHWVRGIDLHHPWFEPSPADEFLVGDLRLPETCETATREVEHVYALAADMGGMGFISAHHGTIFRNNALIDLHTMDAARTNGCHRLLYASTACVYPDHLQQHADAPGLREEDVMPASPQDAYGWEKLFGELWQRFAADEWDIEVRTVRLHNVYGPLGTYDGGREKAPAALCRKVALVEDGGTIEIWGDGEQSRSFCYVDDCVEGLLRLVASDYDEPVNLGTEQLVTINDLARLVLDHAGKRGVSLRHVDGPQGVRGRNSDNTRVRKVLDWEPGVSLEDGMGRTYDWIAARLHSR